jgi:hypothetical protein
MGDRCLHADAKGDHLRHEGAVLHHLRGVGVLDDHQICVGDLRHQQKDEQVHRIYEDVLHDPNLNEGATDGHRPDGAWLDDCRPDVGLPIRTMGVMDAPNVGRLRLYVGDGDRDYQV